MNLQCPNCQYPISELTQDVFTTCPGCGEDIFLNDIGEIKLRDTQLQNKIDSDIARLANKLHIEPDTTPKPIQQRLFE